jgi:hypothetical protein
LTSVATSSVASPANEWGPGKEGGTDLAEETDNSEDTTERLATASEIPTTSLYYPLDLRVSFGCRGMSSTSSNFAKSSTCH